MVKAPKTDVAVPAAAAPNVIKPVKPVAAKPAYNRLANLGAFAHPPKKKKK